MDILHNPVFIWFMIGVVLVVAEFFVPGIVLVFFGVSAWVVAALVGFVPNVQGSIAIQTAIWVVLSLVLLFSLRSWLRAQLKGFTANENDLSKMPSESAGTRVEVIEAIDEQTRTGRVRWRGSLWKAEADEAIPAGIMVEIVEQKNLMLKVRKPK